MNSLAPELQDYFPASAISRVTGESKSTTVRRAAREQWPARALGNRLEYQPPQDIARLIVERPTAPAPAREAAVRFADLAHSDAQRENVLRREAAVQLLRATAHLGKETALQLVCTRFATEHPLFKISVSSLRRWDAAYATAGLDGLVEQKRGRVGRKSFAADLAPEHILQLAADAAGHGQWQRGNERRRLNVARAYQNLVANPEVQGPARAWLHGANASKSYVPPSVRDAVHKTVSPLAATYLQRGPKAARLDGPHTECSYDNVPAGQAFTADDMTANVYVWCEWPNEDGYLLIRPQILAVMDVGSHAWLNIRAVMRPKGQYNKDDVWGLLGDMLDHYGLHVDAAGKVDTIAVLEGGTWQSGVVVGEKTGLDDETRFGGLRSLGVKVIHTRTPRAKLIETNFHKLQAAADNCRGYCGRMEMKDCPEDVKQQLALVKAGHAHPKQFFLHIKEYSNHLQSVMAQLIQERNDGKILRGECPADKWLADNPSMRPFPAESKWMYRASYRIVAVTRNGVRVSVGTGKYATHYFYSAPELENHRGRRVVVYWNDYDPDTDAVIYSLRAGKPDRLICVAPRAQVLPRFGANGDQLSAEASRKKLSQQLAVTQSRTLAPFLARKSTADLPPAPQRLALTPAANPGEAIAAAQDNAATRRQQTANVRKFRGDAAELLDESPERGALLRDSESDFQNEKAAERGITTTDDSAVNQAALLSPDAPDLDPAELL